METILNNPYLIIISILSILNLLLIVVLFWQFQVYRKKQNALLAGEESGLTLQDIVLKHKQTLLNHNKNLKELGKILAELVENNRFNVQKVGLIRFNPFADTGGNISFALALLDGHNNGIVISSLYSREGSRIYAKPIENGQSSHHLTEEEREAIADANRKTRR